MAENGSVRAEHAVHGTGTVESWRRGGRVAVVRFDRHSFPFEVPARDLVLCGPASTPPSSGLRPAPSPAPRAAKPAPAARSPEAARPEPAKPAAPAPPPAPPASPPASQTGRGAAPPSAAAAPAGLEHPRPGSGALAGTYEHHRAARTLEAMRLGVVPDADLAAYTVGRDADLALVDEDLAAADERGGAVRAFLGDYGVGKTHMLELVLSRALARGFLVGSVTLDPRETPPSHPKRVYHGLMRSLRYPDRPAEQDVGLGPLLERAASSREALALVGVDPRPRGSDVEAQVRAGLHVYLAAALAYARTLGQDGVARRLRDVPADRADAWLTESRDLLVDWLEGHPTLQNQLLDTRLSRLPGGHPKIYSLCDYRPWSRIYGHVLSGISTLARAVGYRGLVVVLDEAEFYALLSRENREFASYLFKAWTYAAVGGGDANGEEEDLPFPAEDLEIGGYGVLKRLPPRYRAHPGLYVVFAMTPTPDGVAALRGAIPAERMHTLTQLDEEHYLELGRRVCDFYASAQQSWKLPEKLVAPLGKVLTGLIGSGYVKNPRQAMKFIIEFLDIVRFQPESAGGVVRALAQQLAW